jgi:hypothetical protein
MIDIDLLAMKMFSIGKNVSYGYPGGYIEPFYAGKIDSSHETFKFYDDGINNSILSLNHAFSELTAHYWVWKNVKNTDIIGFCHYRRYFNFIWNSSYSLPKIWVEPNRELMQFIGSELQEEKIRKIMRTYDLITGRTYVLNENIETQFCRNHEKYVWEKYIDILEDVCPDYIVNNIDYYAESHEFRFYPIFITRWEIFDELCQLMFPVLFRLFHEVGELSDQRDVRFSINRYPAYIAERFFMLFIHARKLRVFGAQIIATENNA